MVQFIFILLEIFKGFKIFYTRNIKYVIISNYYFKNSKWLSKICAFYQLAGIASSVASLFYFVSDIRYFLHIIQ